LSFFESTEYDDIRFSPLSEDLSAPALQAYIESILYVEWKLVLRKAEPVTSQNFAV